MRRVSSRHFDKKKNYVLEFLQDFEIRISSLEDWSLQDSITSNLTWLALWIRGQILPRQI